MRPAPPRAYAPVRHAPGGRRVSRCAESDAGAPAAMFREELAGGHGRGK
jgi:hypothetical protein